MTGYCEKCATRVHTSDHGTRCESCLIAERDEAVRLLRLALTLNYDQLPRWSASVGDFLSRIASVKA